jgi:hypothetical protein
MSALLTEDEKARTRRHLGYPESTSPIIYAMGMVQPTQPAFLLEMAMNHLTEESKERVQTLLGVLDGFEAKIIKAACLLSAQQVGEITLRTNANQNTTDLLRKEYKYWCQRLADCLGVTMYPYATHAGGNMNVRVAR